jgi:tRNA(fMet)-specific endonuclease VapC
MIRALLTDWQELPFEREDANAAPAIRAALGRRGTPIGPYDVMIGGTALRRGLTLVTSKGDEFERIGGLVV